MSEYPCPMCGAGIFFSACGCDECGYRVDDVSEKKNPISPMSLDFLIDGFYEIANSCRKEKFDPRVRASIWEGAARLVEQHREALEAGMRGTLKWIQQATANGEALAWFLADEDGKVNYMNMGWSDKQSCIIFSESLGFTAEFVDAKEIYGTKKNVEE